MPQANTVSVKSMNGPEFIVRVRPRGELTYESPSDTGPAFLADLWGEFLHYTVFRRRWWVEAYPPPRPLRARDRWAETVASEGMARERMAVLIAAIENGSWVPGTASSPPGGPSGNAH
jgi:hypothetical protein